MFSYCSFLPPDEALSLLHEPLLRGCGHNDILTGQTKRSVLIDVKVDQSERFQRCHSNPSRV